MDYHKLELIKECITEYIDTYKLLEDTGDFIDIKTQNKLTKIILKEQKKSFKDVNKEDKTYQKNKKKKAKNVKKETKKKERLRRKEIKKQKRKEQKLKLKTFFKSIPSFFGKIFKRKKKEHKQ